MKYKYHILLAIFIIGFISSVILTTEETPIFCGTESGCNYVTSSQYAYTFGIKNSEYGIFVFAFLALLTFLHIKKPHTIKKATIHTGTIIGAIVAIYFLYLQQFVLNAYCRYCIVVDTGLIIGLIIILAKWEK